MGAPKNTALIPYVVLLGLVGFVGFGSSTLEQDKAECGEKLVGLATCLNFVGGQASSPTSDCCRGLKTVVEKSTKCLCVLVKDRDDPELDIKFNVTRALQLPSTCHVPLNLTACVDLLGLAPNSTDAKVFEDFAKSLGNGTSTSASPAARTDGNSTSHGNTAAKGERDGIIIRF
ncbi:protein YLS3 [Morus notabilis]|uniref:protein YLS3 n=1 Tax=Morus notabilis TaxID=981085 RepID=UPI000CED30AD|nr:protein YLS3 [Morus notabilis]